MFFLKRAYCRTSQAVFKAAIPFLPYTDPLILEKITDIPAVLKKQNISSVLLITDGALYKLGLTAPLEAALTESGVRFSVYADTVPNPTVGNVEAARDIYIKEGHAGIIGFGGGSAIDCAKMVGARVARKGRTVRQMKGVFRVWRRLPFLVAVPTTAGTGSETTASALITDPATHEKFPINDLYLIPRVAVLDAEITKSLPKSLVATTGMDALTHAVEAYIGRSTVKSTRADALKAVRLIFENLQRVYTDAEDEEARKNMLYASFYAGRAFAKSYVGYCHAVAHSLGGRYNIPHGLANAVLLPYVLEAYGNTVYKKLKTLAAAAGLPEAEQEDKTAAEAFIAHIRQMNADMGIPTKLQGIRKRDIPALAAIAEKEGNPFYPVPKLLTAKELEQFYYDILEG